MNEQKDDDKAVALPVHGDVVERISQRRAHGDLTDDERAAGLWWGPSGDDDASDVLLYRNGRSLARANERHWEVFEAPWDAKNPSPIAWGQEGSRQENRAAAAREARARKLLRPPPAEPERPAEGSTVPEGSALMVEAIHLRAQIAEAGIREIDLRARVAELEARTEKLMKVQANQHVEQVFEYERQLERADRLWESKSARVAALEAQPAAAPSGLRVAALLDALVDVRDLADREITARVIGHDMISAAQAEGEKRGLDRAMAEIRAHLGEPTPAERAAAEVLGLDPTDAFGEFVGGLLAELVGDFCAKNNVDERTACAWFARMALAGMVACDTKGGA